MGDRVPAPDLHMPEFEDEGAEVCHCRSLAVEWFSADALLMGRPSGTQEQAFLRVNHLAQPRRLCFLRLAGALTERAHS